MMVIYGPKHVASHKILYIIVQVSNELTVEIFFYVYLTKHFT